jgi:hypothetical protein
VFYLLAAKIDLFHDGDNDAYASMSKKIHCFVLEMTKRKIETEVMDGESFELISNVTHLRSKCKISIKVVHVHYIVVLDPSVLNSFVDFKMSKNHYQNHSFIYTYSLPRCLHFESLRSPWLAFEWFPEYIN